jgi:hypothetical protein
MRRHNIYGRGWRDDTAEFIATTGADTIEKIPFGVGATIASIWRSLIPAITGRNYGPTRSITTIGSPYKNLNDWRLIDHITKGFLPSTDLINQLINDFEGSYEIDPIIINYLISN